MESFLDSIVPIIVTILGALGLYLFSENKRKDSELKNSKEKLREKEEIITRKQMNLNILKDHHNAVNDIKKNKKDIDKKIKEAQTSEDAKNIIDSIIRANNDRLSND